MTEILLTDGRALADVSDVVGESTVDFRVGQAGQVTIPVADAAKVLRADLLGKGSRLVIDGDTFDVSVVSREYGAQVAAELLARSSLVRALRKATGAKAGNKVTPQTWITAAVKAAGGSAVVQPGANRRRIVQRRNRSALSVIADLASDMSAEWCEHSNTIFVGTPYWALQGNTGLPTWPAEVDGEAVHRFTVRESDDDTRASATAEADLAREFGVKVRPWHRLTVRDAAFADDNGLWLVEAVTWTDNPARPVSVSLSRPLKSSIQKGSSSTAGAGSEFTGDIAVGPAGFFDGADKVWMNCTRTPRQFTKLALSQVGQPYENYRCLRWVSEMVSGRAGRGGDYARYVWQNRPAGTPTTSSRTPAAGLIVVWDQEANGGHGGVAGHIGISIGGGRFVSATGGTVQIDTIAGGWARGYFGAMAPNFFV